MKLSKRELATLPCIYEGNNSIIYRKDSSEHGGPVIIKLSKHVYPAPQQIVRFATEYALIKDLDIAGVRKVYDSGTLDDRPLLIMAYVEGETIWHAFVEQRRSLAEMLMLAISVAQVLGEVHRNNIIHKNINSHHILVNLERQAATLIDFGIASQVNFKTRYPEIPDVLEGTLAYISPEQTGRINRAVDYRTDLYSLGVVLYEMLTGRLPFNTTDVSELVHCHIARHPVPVHEVNSDIPEAISNIVMKLMAKNADDRYQSAFGLIADLEYCLQQLNETGAILNLELAGADYSEKLEIPQKLYGREQEMNALIQVLERVQKGTSEIVMVSGRAGMGKSWLVHELGRLVIEKGGYFVSGNCNQYQRNIPHHALMQAFVELVNVMLTEGADQLAQWKIDILEAVGDNGQLLINMVSDLEWIIGPQPPVQELSPVEAQQRLLQVSLSFLRVIAQKEHPLLFLIDDLQWADVASLHFLNLLMTHVENFPLLFIGAYRDDQVEASHPLMQMVADMTQQPPAITTIHLDDLSHDEVNQLLSDTLQCEPSETRALASLVHEKTSGNPFFATELVQSWYEDGLLTFAFESRRWVWDIARFRDTAVTDDMATLMTRKIETLPENTRELLKLAACIGNTFTLKTLAAIAAQPVKPAFNHLWRAIEERLVLPLDDNYKVMLTLSDGQPPAIDCRFEFSHSSARQAAYAMISTRRKRAVHLEIGRMRLQETKEDVLKEHIFDIVDHLNEGFRYIQDEPEKLRLAELNLIAGHRTKNEAAYQEAIWYLSMGIGLLPYDKWDRYYNLTCDLYAEAVEAELLSANFERALLLIDEALQWAKDSKDKIKMHKLQILVYRAQNLNAEAIEAALAALEAVEVLLSPTERAYRPPAVAKAPTLLDTATIIKASHMLSQEIRLDQLLDKMIHIVIENAGAEKGILIENQRRKLFIQAKGQVGQQMVETMQGMPVEESGDVPLSVVNYVARTKTAVVLNDASRNNAYAVDKYIAQHQIKSLLCLPIIHQSKLLGLLYLENNLATNVFTPDRLELLQALSSQAAISMQNANLYASLEEKIKELEQVEQARMNSERRLADIIDFLPDATFAVDLNGKVILWNQAAEAFTGVLAGDILGKGNYEYAIPFYGEQRPILLDLLFKPDPEFERLYLNFKREGGLVFGESYTKSARQRDAYLTAVAAPLYDSQGNVIGAIETIHDITDRKQAEEALRVSETRFRTIVDHAADAFFLHDEMGFILDVNQQACDSLGYSRKELIGMKPHDFDAGVEPSFIDQMAARQDAGEVIEFETQHRRKDGTVFPVEIRTRPLRQGDRRFSVSLARNITERKQAQEALTLFRTLLDYSNDAIQVLDPETGRFLDANERAYQTLGYTREEFLNLTVFDTDVLASEPSGQQALARFRHAGTQVHESLHRRKDGSTFPVEVNVNLVHLDRDYALAVVRDIAERKQAEAQLLAREQLFRALVENSPDFVARYDKEFRRIYVNPAIQRLFTGSEEDVLGKTPADQSPHYAPQVYMERLQQTIETPTESALEMPYRTAQGEMHWAQIRFVPEFDSEGQVATVLTIGRDIHEIKKNEQRFRMLADNFPDIVVRYDHDGRFTYANSAVGSMFEVPAEAIIGKTLHELITHGNTSIQVDELWTLLRRTFDEGTLNEMESHWETDEGERIFAIRYVPEKDAAGNVVSVLSIIREITERKHAEEEIRRFNQELEQRVAKRTAQLEAANQELEAFAYSVSHDLRAPLRHIDGFLELLQQQMDKPLNERSQRYMDTISDSANRMGQLIDDLLTFSRMGRNELSKSLVDLDSMVKDVLQEFELETQDRTIHWRIADLPPVNGDQAMLRLVLTNLIANALKFTRNCTVTEIEIGYTPGEKESTIFISDNGVGFDMTYAGKLFGVFQRLHHTDEFEGTGIGLANVRRIINRHGGRTWAEGSVNHGATFYFTLPQVTNEKVISKGNS